MICENGLSASISKFRSNGACDDAAPPNLSISSLMNLNAVSIWSYSFLLAISGYIITPAAAKRRTPPMTYSIVDEPDLPPSTSPARPASICSADTAIIIVP